MLEISNQINYADILQECAKIANDRQSQYGEATESVELATQILKDNFNINLTPVEFCFVMVSLKLSRQKFKFKEDNIIDSINYLAIAIACKRKNG